MNIHLEEMRLLQEAVYDSSGVFVQIRTLTAVESQSLAEQPDNKWIAIISGGKLIGYTHLYNLERACEQIRAAVKP